jgi:DNA repair protein RecN (Recombination protein N)
MITSLSIENFALIEKLSIQFSDGFSTITGETGAGKSIILGALGLVLGKRADLSSLKNKEEKCIIEAQFNIENYNLQSFFDDNDIDYEKETIIRREILPSGKSRAFINDTPVNLQDLQDLSSHLVDIHSQNQTLQLAENDFQFEIIDAVANNASDLNTYKQKLSDFKKSKVQLAEKSDLLTSIKKEQDYNLFLYNELAEAKLTNVNQEDLESNLEKLSNVELLKENFQKIISIATDEQFGIVNNLKEIKFALQKTANFSKEYLNLLERLNSVLIEFDDIEKEIEAQSESLFSNPEELELINQKLQLIYSLQKKHAVNSIEELVVIEKELENKVISVGNLEIEISNLNIEIDKSEKELNTISKLIYDNRIEAIPKLSSQISSILEQLGMPNAKLKIELNHSDDFFQNGKDEIQFLFSANKGLEFGQLKKVASGGEMSRIMLAVKYILSQFSNLPTIIFDEIDTGVSGEIANKMGEIMKEMSKSMQVFSITHLPQIAAKGKQHFKVFKFENANTTISELKLLTQPEREQEIAEMLSGKSISDSALNHAKALLN